MAKDKAVPAAKPEDVKPNLPAVQQMDAADLTDMYGDMGKEHFNVPRLIILEQLNPQVSQGLGVVGEFFVAGPNTKLGTDPIEIVVLMRSHSRMSWKPMAEGGGLLCQAQDGKKGVGTPGGDCLTCPQKDWGVGIAGAKPKCDLYENFVVVKRSELALPLGEQQLMAISGSRARLKNLKAFNNMLHPLMQRKLPLFAKSFLVCRVPQTKGANTFHVYAFKPGNENALISPAEQNMAFQLYKQFAGKISIDQENPDSGPSAAPEDAPTY